MWVEMSCALQRVTRHLDEQSPCTACAYVVCRRLRAGIARRLVFGDMTYGAASKRTRPRSFDSAPCSGNTDIEAGYFQATDRRTTCSTCNAMPRSPHQLADNTPSAPSSRSYTDAPACCASGGASCSETVHMVVIYTKFARLIMATQ